MRSALACLVLIAATACGAPPPEAPTVRITVDATPPRATVDAAPTWDLPELSAPAEAKIAAIRDVLARNSLARLVRLADNEPTFVSNFAGEPHRVYWDLLRRTGFDPLAQLGDLLDGPYAVHEVGDETWYIWPDLAARSPEELQLERLTFSERARLQALVGEVGIARIREGQGYPGVRTAIAEDGRWLYYVNEAEDETGGN